MRMMMMQAGNGRWQKLARVALQTNYRNRYMALVPGS